MHTKLLSSASPGAIDATTQSIASSHEISQRQPEIGERSSRDDAAAANPEPRAFGLIKAMYSVNETLEVLSLGRTSLYAIVAKGALHPVKFGKKTLFYASDLARFLQKLREAS